MRDIRIHAAGGKPSHAVIFFHGYGSNGREIADFLAADLSHASPGAVLRFPDGPDRSLGPVDGRSWFPVEDMIHQPDGNIIAPRIAAATGKINDYIGRVLAEENLDRDRLILAGFSQGGSIAFYAGLLHPDPAAGICAISGGALDQIVGWAQSKSPVLLMAGEHEDSCYSGRQHAQKTQSYLQQAGFKSELIITPDNGHAIDANSIAALTDFTRRCFSAPAHAPSLLKTITPRPPRP